MQTKDYERVKWRCRRGMLEIDLFLVPFFENCYDGLSVDEQESFRLFLEEQDPDLHAYLMAQRVYENDKLRALVDKIRDHRFNVSRNQFL